MCAYVMGVVRSATHLETLTYEVHEPGDGQFPWRRTHVCERRPLEPRSHPALWTAWRAIESVSRWDGETLDHVLTVLRETVPSFDEHGDLPALGREVYPPAEPRATAAHPRAYRGTKQRPPRPRQPEAIDVRPYLLARRHTDQVLELLGQPRGIDPYVAWNHGVDATASFEPPFVAFLLPLFRACTWSQVGAFASLARTLQLAVQPELRAALVGVFVAAADPDRALGWWSHVLACEPPHRLEAAQLIAASAVAKVEPPDASVASMVAALEPVQQWWFYRGLVAGASPAYLFSGFQLGALPGNRRDELPPGRVDVAPIIESTIARLDKGMDEDSGPAFWRQELWWLCGHQPELIALLASPDFVSLRPEAGFWLTRLANSPRWEPATAEQRWRVLAPELAKLIGLAARLDPEYQRKFVEDMSDIYLWAVDHEPDVTDALARCVELCRHIARSPFRTESVLGIWLLFMAVVRRELLEAPDSSWLALEEACKRVNQQRLLGRGLERMARFAPTLLARAFCATPSALLQTADSLAAVSLEMAKQILVAYASSAIADPALADAPFDRLCEVVAPIARAGGPNPVRRALREHLSGEAPLSEAQLRGHRDRIIADLGIVRLAAIRQAVERALVVSVGIEKIETPAARHALAMLSNVDVHRRQLRRMLTANLAGDRDWKLRHPRTQQWLARHPRLNREIWLKGVELRGELAGHGELRLGIEDDPLEALKLGTYVGSCLGRGGHLEYSAAAVVLDVNKQVVYARDARGSVIGRQLLAISEDDELVCFSVYGLANPELLKPLFRDFDRRFAAELRIPLFGTGPQADDGFEVTSILSHDWWNDLAWAEVDRE